MEGLNIELPKQKFNVNKRTQELLGFTETLKLKAIFKYADNVINKWLFIDGNKLQMNLILFPNDCDEK